MKPCPAAGSCKVRGQWGILQGHPEVLLLHPGCPAAPHGEPTPFGTFLEVLPEGSRRSGSHLCNRRSNETSFLPLLSVTRPHRRLVHSPRLRLFICPLTHPYDLSISVSGKGQRSVVRMLLAKGQLQPPPRFCQAYEEDIVALRAAGRHGTWPLYVPVYVSVCVCVCVN